MEFKVGDRVVLVSSVDEVFDLYNGMIGAFGIVTHCYDRTVGVRFDNGYNLQPYKRNLQYPKQHYLKLFKKLYEATT